MAWGGEFQGLDQLLRRAPIVALEDSEPLPHFVLPTVWMMMAMAPKEGREA